MSDTARCKVLITSPLEPHLVERIRAVDPRLEVVFEPELIPRARYPADHRGTSLQRTVEQEDRWRDLLGSAEILFDFDITHRSDLPELAPEVRWIQGSSAGIGTLMRRERYVERLPNTLFTTASGVHSKPLAEFCLMAILAHTKQLPRMLANQDRRKWEVFASTDLSGRTIAIVGAGKIGIELAHRCKAFDMEVLGVKRSVTGIRPADLHMDELHSMDNLHAVLPRAQFLVLITPHTPNTENLIGSAELALLPPGAYLINIGRGIALDETALRESIIAGHLAGATLDVFRTEPLPEDSPLWRVPQILISPHTGSVTDRENDYLVDLFCDNLRRYLAGERLRNVYDPQLGY